MEIDKELLSETILNMQNVLNSLVNIVNVSANAESKIEYSNSLIGLSYNTATLESLFKDLCICLSSEINQDNMKSTDTNPIGFNLKEEK